MIKLKKEKGISLLEAMISVVILGVAAAIMLGIFQVSFNSISDSSNTYLASLIAQNEMEYDLESGYAGIGGSCAGPCPWNLVSVPNGNQYATFKWQQSVQNINLDLKEVDIIVQWNQKGAGGTYARYVMLSTRIAPTGIAQ